MGRSVSEPRSTQKLVSTLMSNLLGQYLQVRDFVQIVKRAIEEQNSSYDDHLLKLLRPHIAECLYRKESEVTADAWMIHDLGME